MLIEGAPDITYFNFRLGLYAKCPSKNYTQKENGQCKSSDCVKIWLIKVFHDWFRLKRFIGIIIMCT